MYCICFWKTLVSFRFVCEECVPIVGISNFTYNFDTWIELGIVSSLLAIVNHANCPFKFRMGVEMQKLEEGKVKTLSYQSAYLSQLGTPNHVNSGT